MSPKAIFSDNGRRFISVIVKELLHILRIKQQLASTYRPQTDGSLKRSHAPLKNYIRCYSERFSDWDKLVPFATFAYNTSVHTATNFTPIELVYGRIARFPLKISKDEKLRTYNTYLWDLIMHLNEIQIVAGQNLIAAKQKSKEHYDLKSRDFQPRIGDYVRVLIEPRTKNAVDYYGEPCGVVEVLSSKNIVIALPDGSCVSKHIDKLEPAPSRKKGLT